MSRLPRQSVDEEAVRTASLIAFYLPMHTATRIAVRALERVRKLNPPPICADLDCTPQSMPACCVVWASAPSWGESLSRGGRRAFFQGAEWHNSSTLN